MKSKFWAPTVCAVLASLIAGCDQLNSTTAEADLTNTLNLSTAIETDLWLGKWTGGEGTFLKLAGKSNCLTVVVGEGYCRS